MHNSETARTFDRASGNRLTSHDLERFPSGSLFDRLGRAVCAAGCLPRKELFEAWEMARRVRRLFRGGRVVDLAGGHGLLAQVLLLLDDSSASALVVDPALPRSAAKLHDALTSQVASPDRPRDLRGRPYPGRSGPARRPRGLVPRVRRVDRRGPGAGRGRPRPRRRAAVLPRRRRVLRRHAERLVGAGARHRRGTGRTSRGAAAIRSGRRRFPRTSPRRTGCCSALWPIAHDRLAAHGRGAA